MWETGKRTPDFETLINLSDLFDIRTDYLLGKSDDTSSAKLTDEDIEQLGRWELEDTFTDIFKMYLSLDSFGKSTVESLIKSERLRCHEQSTHEDTSKIKISIAIEKIITKRTKAGSQSTLPAFLLYKKHNKTN